MGNNSFDGSILAEEDVAGFFSGADGYHDDEALAKQVKEARYFDEIAEIERLTEVLNSGRLAGQDVDWEARDKGLALLQARRESLDASYTGRPLAEIEAEAAAKAERIRIQSMPLRERARLLGEKTYKTGESCIHGHVAERRTHNGECVECWRVRTHLTKDQQRAKWREQYRRRKAEKAKQSHI